jgi:hypothetical protein
MHPVERGRIMASSIAFSSGPVTSLHTPMPVFSSKAIMATHFRKPVRTRGSPMPTFIRMVESAIEVILSLPERTQARSHWSTAKEALYNAVDTRVQANLARAQSAFEEALAKEQWLF